MLSLQFAFWLLCQHNNSKEFNNNNNNNNYYYYYYYYYIRGQALNRDTEVDCPC
jgi:hypothetical protein